MQINSAHFYGIWILKLIQCHYRPWLKTHLTWSCHFEQIRVSNIMAEDSTLRSSSSRWLMPVFVFFKDARYKFQFSWYFKNGYVDRSYMWLCVTWHQFIVMWNFQACLQDGFNWYGDIKDCISCCLSFSCWSYCFSHWHSIYRPFRYALIENNGELKIYYRS